LILGAAGIFYLHPVKADGDTHQNNSLKKSLCVTFFKTGFSKILI